MKTLLPVLKTKLFLLGFVSACTVILATTVPQIKNFIAPQKAIGEKITTEQKKIAPKSKKQNKIVNASRVTSGVALEMNNSFDATVQTDKVDYYPGEYVIITGSGFTPGETVTLHFDETPKPATCLLSHDLTAVADAGGNIYNAQFLVKENHRGVLFNLTATGQTSGLIAETWFTDATISSTASGDWNSAATWGATGRTGTIEYTNGSTAVIGTGTSFSTELAIGSIIITTGGGTGITRTVASITDDTHLTLTAPSDKTATGKSFTAQVVPFAGDAVVIADGDAVT